MAAYPHAHEDDAEQAVRAGLALVIAVGETCCFPAGRGSASRDQGWSGRRVSPESASAILIAVLGTLEAKNGPGIAVRKQNLILDKSGSI
jgi:hypothetical protein